MKYGKLNLHQLAEKPQLVAKVVIDSLDDASLKEVQVAKTDPDLADTENFCKHYDISLDSSANCVIVQARRAERTWYAAFVVLATTRADVNKTIKKRLDARKISFAPMDTAIELTQMEYGGITPIGLPKDWPILIDDQVATGKKLIIGSGIRGSKLMVDGKFLVNLPNAEVLGLAIEQ